MKIQEWVKKKIRVMYVYVLRGHRDSIVEYIKMNISSRKPGKYSSLGKDSPHHCSLPLQLELISPPG